MRREATAMRSPCTTTKSSPRSLQLEKARAQQCRPKAAKKTQTKTKQNKKTRVNNSLSYSGQAGRQQAGAVRLGGRAALAEAIRQVQSACPYGMTLTHLTLLKDANQL